MIAYVFLAGGVAGAGALVYFVAPAGSGLHRRVVPRSQLRADIDRLEAENDRLAHNIVELLLSRHEARTELDDTAKALTEASLRIAELEERLRDADQLRESNTALKAALANATAVRQLPPHGDTAPPAAQPIPLNQAPFALSPAAEPS